MLNPIKPVKLLHDEIINEEVKNIQRINNFEVYVNHLNNLYIECLVCYETLKKLSHNCIQAAQYLKNYKEHQNVSSNFSFLKTFPFLANHQTKERIIKFFKVIFFILLTIGVAPIFLLFWVFKDPYKKQFCSFHFHLRPITKERLRRLTIYFLISLFWIIGLVILILFFI